MELLVEALKIGVPECIVTCMEEHASERAIRYETGLRETLNLLWIMRRYHAMDESQRFRASTFMSGRTVPDEEYADLEFIKVWRELPAGSQEKMEDFLVATRSPRDRDESTLPFEAYLVRAIQFGGDPWRRSSWMNDVLSSGSSFLKDKGRA